MNKSTKSVSSAQPVWSVSASPAAGDTLFEVLVCLAASARSAGKPYKEALDSRWCMDKPIPANMADLPVYDAQADIEKITSMVDFVFCAVDMKKDEIRAWRSSMPSTSARWYLTTLPTGSLRMCPWWYRS